MLLKVDLAFTGSMQTQLAIVGIYPIRKYSIAGTLMNWFISFVEYL